MIWPIAGARASIIEIANVYVSFFFNSFCSLLILINIFRCSFRAFLFESTMVHCTVSRCCWKTLQRPRNKCAYECVESYFSSFMTFAAASTIFSPMGSITWHAEWKIFARKEHVLTWLLHHYFAVASVLGAATVNVVRGHLRTLIITRASKSATAVWWSMLWR